ncbi:MAG: D-glycero-beta-D-manno-heptose 1-phosphate adenylyltransferase [Elusimicrobia bacterium]|nr:D-glycero-beta-D-manno-heptose 1-phosphate adenylyltransferase [Elusimicrobiota bacterium]
MSTAAKFLSRPAAIAKRRAWKKAGKRVVFTNGVFDILHRGHVDLLEKARSLGDALIVGVNKDASVRRLNKGPERPINKEADRVRVLSGLASVDAVTLFGEDTPAELLSALKPDILVKGADYKPDQVAGREHAGKVVLITLTKGYSTTSVVKRLKR